MNASALKIHKILHLELENGIHFKLYGILN